MPKNDLSRLRHMQEAAAEAIAYAKGKNILDLEADRMRALALTRCIEIIGEAAASVSAEYKANHPELPWKVMAAMRNRLIHAYFEVDLKVVLDTAHHDLPPLVGLLDSLIAELPEPPSEPI